MTESNQKGKCLSDTCNRDALVRGYCLSHYQVIAIAVKKGDLSWQELESKGLAKSSKRKSLVDSLKEKLKDTI